MRQQFEALQKSTGNLPEQEPSGKKEELQELQKELEELQEEFKTAKENLKISQTLLKNLYDNEDIPHRLSPEKMAEVSSIDKKAQRS